MFRCWLAAIFFFLYLCGNAIASEMKSRDFVKGISYELEGRATMRAITASLSDRFEEGELHVYWSSYNRLEEFSKGRYEKVARRLGIELPGNTWILTKAKIVSFLPEFAILLVLKDLRERTIVYIDKLQKIAEIGPVEEGEFYGYMIRQEKLQVELMDLALSGKYMVADDVVNQFIDRESQLRRRLL